jgi:hypothetical protein
VAQWRPWPNPAQGLAGQWPQRFFAVGLNPGTASAGAASAGAINRPLGLMVLMGRMEPPERLEKLGPTWATGADFAVPT